MTETIFGNIPFDVYFFINLVHVPSADMKEIYDLHCGQTKCSGFPPWELL